MKKIAAASLAFAAAAFAYQPTQNDLLAELARAEGAWGEHAEVSAAKLKRLNGCKSTSDIGALSDFDRHTITINSACHWSRDTFAIAVAHEYGHMLRGNAEHSADPVSVMYPQLARHQQVTAEDKQHVHKEARRQ